MKGQKSRKSKTSNGLRRSSLPVKLTVIELALLGKGLTHVHNSKRKKK